MAFSSSKVEAPQITGSLFGTSSWAVSASWAPSSVSDRVAYQTAQSGTLFDVTSEVNNIPSTRSIGGALKPGDVSVLLQNINPGGVIISESYHLVYKRSSTGSIPISVGGTGLPQSRYNGEAWTQLLTGDSVYISTYLPAALSSSIEGTVQGSQYHSGSAVTGALYYDVTRGQYRVFKGLGNGGWQDLVSSGGSGGAFPFTGSAAISGTFQLDSTGSQRNKFATSSVFGNQPIQAAAAFGSNNEISASNAFAFGFGNKIAGQQAMAVGGQNIIGQFGGVSFAAGSSNLITASISSTGEGNGGAQVAMGYRSTSSAVLAMAIGTAVHAAGTSSFAQGGLYTRSGSFGGPNFEILASGGLALGGGSHAEGLYTTAIGVGSHAEGGGVIIPTTGSWTSLVGIQGGVAIGSGSHAEGRETTAIGNWSHTQGLDTVALGNYQFVAGQWNELVPSSSAFIIGDGTSDSQRHNLIYASGGRVDISGSLYVNGTEVSAGGGGAASTLQEVTTAGSTTTASVSILSNLVQGESGIASNFSHTEGRSVTASGFYSHAEGNFTTALGNWSHAEGSGTTAEGIGDHAEGGGSIARGNYSHAEGDVTTAAGPWSHTEGRGTTAGSSATATHVAGAYNISNANYQSVVGQYNQVNSTAGAFIVGNGASAGSRSNVLFAGGTSVQVTGSLLIQSASSNGEAVSNIGDTYTSTAKVTKMVTCTSAEYAAIATKDPNTFYIVI